VVGAILIDGPATANYNTDLGTVTLSDWFYTATWRLAAIAAQGGQPPQAQNILVNGTMKSATNTGSYKQITYVLSNTMK